MQRIFLAFLIAAAPESTWAQSQPAQQSPGEATQQIMPSSVLSPSATSSIDNSDDPFAGGPVDAPFDAMGPMQSLPRIVLFDRADFTGRRIGLTEDDADLADHSFSAVASSARVHGGAWELCDAAGFTGHCIEIRADADLEEQAFGDKAVSVRLIR